MRVSELAKGTRVKRLKHKKATLVEPWELHLGRLRADATKPPISFNCILGTTRKIDHAVHAGQVAVAFHDAAFLRDFFRQHVEADLPISNVAANLHRTKPCPSSQPTSSGAARPRCAAAQSPRAVLPEGVMRRGLGDVDVLLQGAVRSALLQGGVRTALLQGAVRTALLQGAVRTALLQGAVRSALLQGAVRTALLQGAVRSALLQAVERAAPHAPSIRKNPSTVASTLFGHGQLGAPLEGRVRSALLQAANRELVGQELVPCLFKFAALWAAAAVLCVFKLSLIHI